MTLHQPWQYPHLGGRTARESGSISTWGGAALRPTRHAKPSSSDKEPFVTFAQVYVVAVLVIPLVLVFMNRLREEESTHCGCGNIAA